MSILSENQNSTRPFPIELAEQWNIWRSLYDFGFNLIPLRTEDKKPKVGYLDWCERRQPEWYFEEIYRLHRPCEMALHTGMVWSGLPGLVVIESDDPESAHLVDLRCPPTPMMNRARRGFHRFYRHPGGDYIPQKTEHFIDGRTYKIDRKADHNYVVAPGSIHKSGHVYSWVTPVTRELLDRVPVFDPDWLAESKKPFKGKSLKHTFDHDQACNEEATPLEERIKRATQYAIKTPGTVEGESTASNAALRLAGKIALGFLLPPEEAVKVLMDHWAEKPDQDPPWQEKEIRHKVNSAIANPGGYPGTPGDKLRSHEDPTEEQLEEVVGRRPNVSAEEPPEEPKGKSKSVSAGLIRMVRARAEMFRDDDGTSYALVQVGGHRETMAVASKTFRMWVSGEWFHLTGTPAKSEPLKEALGIIEWLASHQPRRPVFLRWAQWQDRLYLDLGNDAWEVVEIDRDGWRILSNPPVVFRRNSNLAALPTPHRGGSLDDLRPFFTGDDDAYILYKGAILAAVTGGSYFITCIHGEQGSAKSWACKFARRLIDPVGKVELTGLPKVIDDNVIKVIHQRHAVCYDNVSGFSADVSDFLCTLSTGGGQQVRKLYTDDELYAYDYMRPVFMNGIPDFTERPDLADRSITLQMPLLVHKTDEDKLDADWRAALPGILSGLLDTIATGFRRLPQTTADSSLRMGKAVRWVDACLGSQRFSGLYKANREASAETGLDSSAVASILIPFAKDGSWSGNASQLRADLIAFALLNRLDIAKNFPSQPNALSGELRRIAPALRDRRDLQVDFKHIKGAKIIDIKLNIPVAVTTTAPVQKPVENPPRELESRETDFNAPLFPPTHAPIPFSYNWRNKKLSPPPLLVQMAPVQDDEWSAELRLVASQ